MRAERIMLYSAIPLFALLGGLMLALSMGASAPLFGLYLSIGAWMLVLAFAVLPYLLYRRWRAGRGDSD
ncbi:MAG TPA: hypothetical protein VEH07_09355 [Alphaproteobacteria bacterium]|nr:hypothetical protein [Alphaproteobacteria bacterium]